MHQERTYPGRVSGTRLSSPDFAMLVRSYGLHGETVEKTAEFADAFKRCGASGKPGLIEIRIDPEALTPKMSLTQIHEQALASGKGT
jgi:acetolactate synthase-1/2/3 large subunit